MPEETCRLQQMDPPAPERALHRRSRVFSPSAGYQPEVAGAYRLQFMAVEPSLQRAGLGTLVLTEGLRRLRSAQVPLLWPTARPEAVPFYQRFGFAVGPALKSETTDQTTILLDLTA